MEGTAWLPLSGRDPGRDAPQRRLELERTFCRTGRNLSSPELDLRGSASIEGARSRLRGLVSSQLNVHLVALGRAKRERPPAPPQGFASASSCWPARRRTRASGPTSKVIRRE